jgi:DNA repair exonuclease SbcCD ATPase subunit
LQKEYNDFKENSVDLEKYKKLQEDMKRKKQRINTLLEDNEHLTKINSDYKLKSDNFKNEIVRIKNDRKLELNKIKSQMYGEIEEIQLRNTSLENTNEDYKLKLTHIHNELKQSEIVKQSLLDQILTLNNQLMAKDNEMKETVSHYETMVNNMLNSN